jgi:hypothetical protein
VRNSARAMNLAQPLPFAFEPAALPPHAESLRAEVRAFLDVELKSLAPELKARSWGGYDPAFSKKLEIGRAHG